MPGEMTINEVKSAKKELQSEILSLVKRFEADTATKLGYVSLERDSDKYYDEVPDLAEEDKYKPIRKVEVSMDIDVI